VAEFPPTPSFFTCHSFAKAGRLALASDGDFFGGLNYYF